LWGLGMMFAAGGSAIIATKMGAGYARKARQNFTAIIITGSVFGFILALLGTIFLDTIIWALGANAAILPYGRVYLGALILFAPAVLVQVLFQNLFVTAGKPQFGLAVMIGAGVTNLVLDFIFIAIMDMGILGAALGTGAGYCISTIAGLLFFSKQKGTLRFTKPKIKLHELVFCCYNGSSELVTQLATAITIFIINMMTMRFAGEKGVAAAAIIGNTQYLFSTLVLGFSMGVAPIISYQYGAQNKGELRRMVKLCFLYEICISVGLFLLCMLSAPVITNLYTARGTQAYQIAVDGLKIFSYSFLFSGIAIFVSALFTALSNGKVSAFLSFIRTFALLTLFLLLLPRIWGIMGVWYATPLADMIGTLLSIGLLFVYRKKYFG